MSTWGDVVLAGGAFGLASSLHCAGMCGPLALLFLGGTAAERSRSARKAAWAYQGARVLGYVTMGTVVGFAGGLLGSRGLLGDGALVAFVLAGALVLLAVGADRWIARLPGLGRVSARVANETRGWSATARAAAFGAATPLLPCGVSAAGYGAAAVAGGPVLGATAMLAFALGSLPLLAVAQLHAGWLQSRLGPNGLRWIARIAVLAAAAMLVYRGVVSLDGGSCCHDDAVAGGALVSDS